MSFSNEDLMNHLVKDIGHTKLYGDNSSAKHVACYLLQRNLTKKFSDNTTTEAAHKAAVDKFKLVNEAQKCWLFDPDRLSSDVQDILQLARRLFVQQTTDSEGFSKLSLNKAFNLGDVGPGASVGAKSNDILSKLFMSKLTATHPTLLMLYREAIFNNTRWKSAELMREIECGKLKVVQGSNLFTVPKDTEIARVAFTEPTLNMWGQLGYGDLINKLLVRYHSIDIRNQPPINSWFARAGSLNQRFGTIDLQSASDTIGLHFCEWLLPPKMYNDLCFLRSKYARVPGERKLLELHMISTMGNGFTFPLQTLIFANLVLATYIHTRTPVYDVFNKRRYGVFGDDIICDSSVYDLVIQVLEASGFKPNLNKSFNVGRFRESCGTDYFAGINVRAVYLKKCTVDAHVYSLINRLLMWSGRHHVSLLHTTNYLRSLVQYRPIPLDEDQTAGIYTPRQFLTARKRNVHGHYMYKCLQRVKRLEAVSDEIGSRYFHGCVLSSLHGSIRDHNIVPRDQPREEDIVEYKVVSRAWPLSWDHVSDHRKMGIYSGDARTTCEELRLGYFLNMVS